MRLVGGNLRGRRLEAPSGREIRPTSDRTREAIFNILAHADWAPEIEGALVLDAFCGTGALGLEALSRGAARAIFMDQGREALDLVRRNVSALGLAERCEIMRADATRPPHARAPCTLLFLDPPYAKELASTALVALQERGWVAPGALAVVEVGIDDPFAPASGWQLLDTRPYGETRVLFIDLG